MNSAIAQPRIDPSLTGTAVAQVPDRRTHVKNDLAARAKAYAASTTEPIHPWLLEQVRRDAEAAHKWLASQKR